MNKVYLTLKSLLLDGRKPRIRWQMRLMIYARTKGYRLLGRFLEARLQLKYGIFVSRRAVFPRTLDLKHPTGVVIGEGVIIGENVSIYQNVTLGGARSGDWKDNNYPTIGDGTTIFAGAVVIGKISIGRNCVIGANSVVTRSIPDNSTAVGIPARIVCKTEHSLPPEQNIHEQ